MDAKIRVLIADDHAMVRHGLALMLQQKAEFEVVGEAGDGQQAVAQTRSLRPDVVLMDLAMPRMDGVQAAAQIHRELPGVRILMLTSFGEDERLLSAIQAGAAGLLLKDSQPAELLAAIRTIHAGKTSLPPELAQRLVFQMQAPAKPTPAEVPLTEREMEILKLAAAGASNPEIAAQLFISEGTVRFHFSNITHKLNVPNRTQAVLYALRQGWTSL